MKLLTLFAVFFLYSNHSAYTSDIKWQKKFGDKFTIYYTYKDSSNVHALDKFLRNGIKTVENYFEKHFSKKYDVFLFPSRVELDKQWSKEWDIPNFKSECWMVASGVAHRLDILSMNCWKTEACEHNADDKNHIQKIITHELVHVFHGQNNPVPDFTGLDDIGWLIEGAAVLISGQLDSTKTRDLVEAKKLNKLPNQLKKAWSGKYRYIVCGSLVKFIEERYGTEVIFKLLSLTKEKEVLDLLKTTEKDLLARWQEII